MWSGDIVEKRIMLKFSSTKVWVYTLPCFFIWTFNYKLNEIMAQTVKNLPVMQETRVQALGWEDPLEKGMATHSSILAWRIPWTEKPGGLQFVGLQRVGHNWATNTHTCTEKGIINNKRIRIFEKRKEELDTVLTNPFEKKRKEPCQNLKIQF